MLTKIHMMQVVTKTERSWKTFHGYIYNNTVKDICHEKLNSISEVDIKLITDIYHTFFSAFYSHYKTVPYSEFMHSVTLYF